MIANRRIGDGMLSNDVTPSSSTPGERELNDLEQFANVHAPRMLAALGYTFLEERKRHRKAVKNGEGVSDRTSAARCASAIRAKPGKKESSRKGGAKTFWVRFDDGTTIAMPKAKDVFTRAIEKLGVDRVAKLGENRLLSRNKSGFGGYVSGVAKVGGWFLNTHSSTDDKMRRLRLIASRLGVGMEMGYGMAEETDGRQSRGVVPVKESWQGKTQLAKLIARRGGNVGAHGGILQYFAEEGAKARKPCPATSKWRKPLEDAGVRFDNDGYVANWKCARNPL